jgi:ribosomal protein S27E
MLRRSQNRIYGWDVELTCEQCGFAGVPRYEGWSPGLDSGLGENVRVYAKVACPSCGRRLTKEAGKRLIALFRGLDIPAENRRVLSRFILRLFLVPAGLAFVLFFGMQMDWWNWGMGTVWILVVSAIAIPPLVLVRNRRLADLPTRCDCGKAQYVFMGALEGEHCYRCYSCGRLMKLRV